MRLGRESTGPDVLPRGGEGWGSSGWRRSSFGMAGAWVAIRGPDLNPSPKPPVEPRALPIGVSALGRLAPEGEVIALAPSSGADGGRVDRLLVAVGDRVQAGQVVAILDPYIRREAAVRQSQAAGRGRQGQARPGAGRHEAR